MKFGLIVECAPGGLEAVVCPRILELLAAETGTPIDVEVVTMVNKKLLIRGAAQRASILLSEGCDRVVILWDENPPWTAEKDFADERCWHQERDHLIATLKEAQVELKRVGVVCIEREFETWLLHDAPLLCAMLSQGPHRAKVKPLKDPLAIEAPKRHLIGLYRKHKSRFNDSLAALKCRQNVNDLQRFKTCDTFRYFAKMVLGTMPRGWKPYRYQRKGPKS